MHRGAGGAKGGPCRLDDRHGRSPARPESRPVVPGAGPSPTLRRAVYRTRRHGRHMIAAMNRLAREASPYLAQHAANPVDWYPWGEEAFAAARSRQVADLPVDRLCHLPLVPCHGARVVRRPGRRRGPEPRVRVHQGRSRGAARRRSRLHDLRAGHHRQRRMADERLADAVARAVLRRHLLPADCRVGPTVVPGRVPGGGAGLARRRAARRGLGGRGDPAPPRRRSHFGRGHVTRRGVAGGGGRGVGADLR